MSLPRSRTPWNPMRWNCQGSGRLRFARAGCTVAACCCRVTMPPNSIRRADQLPATQQAVQRAGFRPDPSATWQGWMLWDIVLFGLTYRPYRPNSNHISTDSQHRPRLGLHLPHTTTNHGPQHQGKQDRHTLFPDPAFFFSSHQPVSAPSARFQWVGRSQTVLSQSVDSLVVRMRSRPGGTFSPRTSILDLQCMDIHPRGVVKKAHISFHLAPAC